jgi:hypothetical protein
VHARVRGQQDRAAVVDADTAVVVRAEQIDDARVDRAAVRALRDVDVVVVVALAAAVVDVLVVGQVLPAGLHRGGSAVATSSLRYTRACVFGPPPTPMYIRVLPFGSVATSNSARSMSAPVAGLVGTVSGAKICCHVEPLSFERQMPLAKNDAYTVFGSLGSTITRRAPRGEHGVMLRNTSVGELAVQSAGAPCDTSCHDFPPSCERYSPKCGAPGMLAPRLTPSQQTLEMPREPCAPVAT